MLTISKETLERAASLPDSDPLKEAARISAAASVAACTLRVTGGIGIAIRCPSASREPLARTYADIDLFGTRKEARQIGQLMTGLGYRPDDAFNALHGSQRLFFWDQINSRQVDVFLDVFEMCHKLDMSARLRLDALTMTLADLLMFKLQVVETNEKDLKDILSLLNDHQFTSDEAGINLPYLSSLTAADWGLWRTTTMVAERADQFANGLATFDGRARIHEHVAVLLEAFSHSVKSTRWKIRSRVGERVRWYELPEESH
jgi:hypothetical protein